ncbi:UNVERIFIED_CONTAM: hypothetical protein FKN15_070717 [Acipenser sinensis]
MRRNSSCQFYISNPRECLSQCDAPLRVPSKDRHTSQSQDVNLRCMTHPDNAVIWTVSKMKPPKGKKIILELPNSH